MSYSNSSLISYTNLTNHNSGLRTHSIDRITPHCVVGQWSAKKIADYFATTDKEASCNYGIGTNGDISLSVEEKNRSWCSSSNANDQRAITIECASDTLYPYTMNDAVYNSLIKLCSDICKRNGKTKLIWIDDKNTALGYVPKDGEMLLTVHRWFANKSCPGEWLYSRLGDLANKVTSNLGEEPTKEETTDTLYKVQVGAYKSKANASTRVNNLKIVGVDACIIESNGLYKVQAGAFKDKANAEKMVTKIKGLGYDCFIVGENIKTIDELASEVIKGLWGNGKDRKKRLTDAGYDYNKVQARVNELMK